VAELKDNINTMIGNLRLTTAQHRAGLAEDQPRRFTNMLQGTRPCDVGRLLLTELAPLINAHMGVIYQVDDPESRNCGAAAYANDSRTAFADRPVREGLIGQCALDKRQRLVSDIPGDAVRSIRR